LQQAGGQAAVKQVQVRSSGSQDTFQNMNNKWGSDWEMPNAPKFPLDINIIGPDGESVSRRCHLLITCCIQMRWAPMAHHHQTSVFKSMKHGKAFAAFIKHLSILSAGHSIPGHPECWGHRQDANVSAIQDCQSCRPGGELPLLHSSL